MPAKSYGPWTYHPVYGIYSRLVYIKTDEGWTLYERQYGRSKSHSDYKK